MDALLVAILWIVVAVAGFIALLCVCSKCYSAIPPPSYYDDEAGTFAESYTVGRQLSDCNREYPIFQAIPLRRHGRFVVQIVSPGAVDDAIKTPTATPEWGIVRAKHLALKLKQTALRQKPALIPPDDRFKVLWLKIFVEENVVYIVTQFHKHASDEML
ncbi:hypothetical protein ACHHYP_07771 [Achlya hypogyna]|uniref:Uncharacterized protein n=1 Tax=Achlya hypogyna TaxID=1202772 RepID=A0A1V9YQE4_ACHHY|nr:hypothetical protein ACHHYP_07771 [Achlya hypogyna]